MSSSGEAQIPGYDNRGTVVVSADHFMRRAPVELAAIWNALWDDVFAHFAGGRGSGYALVLIDDLGDVQSMTSLGSTDTDLPETLTVGRHTQCGVHVVGDPLIALRHLLLTVSRVDDSEPLLEVSDLRTESGFQVEGLGTVRGALVRGAVNLAFASMRLVALPLEGTNTWPMFPHHAWERFFAEPAVVVQPTLQKNPSAQRERASRGTLISVVQPPLELGEMSEEPTPPREEDPPMPSARVTEEPDNVIWVAAWPRRTENAAVPRMRLALRGPNGRVLMTLTDRDLHRGVLIGRYDRCAGHVEGHVFDNAVSRVHALLRTDPDGRLLIIDTGSTHGVRLESRGGAEVQCAPLEPGDRAWLSPASYLSYEEIQ